MLKISSPTPTNSEIAKSVGKTEGAIRALKKQLPEKNVELINLTYKKDNYSFVKIEEFLQIINEDKIQDGNYSQEQMQEDKNFINEAVETKKMIGSFYTDGNNFKNLFIPPILLQLNEIKELYTENNIKMKVDEIDQSLSLQTLNSEINNLKNGGSSSIGYQP